MSDFYRQKLNRTLWYYQFEFGRKSEACTACSGSGYYDNFGSPACGACGGTGRDKYQTKKSEIMFKYTRSLQETYPTLFEQKDYEQLLKIIEQYRQSQDDTNWTNTTQP